MFFIPVEFFYGTEEICWEPEPLYLEADFYYEKEDEEEEDIASGVVILDI